MDVLGQNLDNRDTEHRADHAARAASGRDAEAEAAFRVWLDNGRRPEERLLKFDTWLRRELANRLDWTWAGSAREKRIEQCRIHLVRLVVQLWQRGWMLDGKRPAAQLQDLLEHVATYQKKGRHRGFLGLIQIIGRAIRRPKRRGDPGGVGNQINQIWATLLAQKPAVGPKIGDLLQQRHEETLRAKLSQARRREADSQATSAQLDLL